MTEKGRLSVKEAAFCQKGGFGDRKEAAFCQKGGFIGTAVTEAAPFSVKFCQILSFSVTEKIGQTFFSKKNFFLEKGFVKNFRDRK